VAVATVILAEMLVVQAVTQLEPLMYPLSAHLQWWWDRVEPATIRILIPVTAMAAAAESLEFSLPGQLAT
jgi:hypothetical protein